MKAAPRSSLIRASAPGRICLFGEHQDYLGLPVIAAAIDLRIYLEAELTEERVFELDLQDIGERLRFDATSEIEYRHDRDYLAAAVNVLRREGLEWPKGLRVTVRSEIPINGGASSSSALQVAWCALLLAAAGDPRHADPDEVARFAHRSEVLEFDSPGGMMDHFASAVGGIIWLDCRPPYSYEKLTPWPGEFLLVDSGEPKDTNGVLGSRRRLLENLGVDLHALPIDPSPPPELLEGRSAEEARALTGTVANRHLSRQARACLRSPKRDPELLGYLLTEHHHHLSENLGVSLPLIDGLLKEGLDLGALGGKINGSGCGGSCFLLCPNKGEELRRHFERLGYRSYVVRIGEGLSVSESGHAEVINL